MMQIESRQIPGWGADLIPARQAAVMMEQESTNAYWDIPELQPKSIIVYKSIEHPSMPPVFGTSVPPSGLSGRIRTYAYDFGEGQAIRWFSLMLADRINVMEGLVDDLKRGHVPNIFAEMGWGAEWKYNRQVFIKKTLVVSGVMACAYVLMRSRKSRLSA